LKRLVFLHQLVLIALVSLLIASCTKDISPIGTKLVDPIDLLSMGYTDTIQIIAYSVPDDSVYTHNLNISNVHYIQLGSMYDPIFGRATSSLYTQLFLSQSRTRFGTSPIFDSAYLYLPYKSSYGDTLSNMTLRVYGLTESIIDSLHSYSYTTLSYDETKPFGEITFQPKPYDSTFYNGKKQAPMLRISINSTFGNSVLRITDTTTLNSNAEFVKVFKGICIIAEPQNTPGKGSILTFVMPSDYIKLQMYYHNTEDTTNYNFAISAGCSRFQNYDHYGYAEAIPMLKQQLDGNTSLGQEFLFAQGMAGAKIKIEFPNLKKSFDAQKIVLNDAQLILGNASVSDVFKNPSYLTLRSIGENGNTSPFNIVDETEGAGYFDGTYNKGSNSYRFRITRYIQQVLNGEINDNGLHLIIPSSEFNSARLVLNGTSSPQSDLKLYLRYTKLK